MRRAVGVGVDFGGGRFLMGDLLLTFERGEVVEVVGLDDRGAISDGWLGSWLLESREKDRFGSGCHRECWL